MDAMGKADYLAKYYSADVHGSGTEKRKKKKKKKNSNRQQPSNLQIRVVDEDVGWPAQHETRSPVIPGSTRDGEESDDGAIRMRALHHSLLI